LTGRSANGKRRSDLAGLDRGGDAIATLIAAALPGLATPGTREPKDLARLGGLPETQSPPQAPRFFRFF
jgi:hypothetical protein